ncbi:MAG TPA: OsmC family protein [Bacteroidia bacterium]|jgi:organic hydroperoxide reductase OsmC/OhrA|nr:OsmC family protein [Bacteroidia bacterium]
MSNTHYYTAIINWKGNLGQGTKEYRGYSRNHEALIASKPTIALSSDPAFRGDKARHNPEELLVISISSCHMLWYLHLCAVAGVVVTDYSDTPVGTLIETPDGSGKFSEVTLYPVVTVEQQDMIDTAKGLHAEAHKMCFIANSCNFPIKHNPSIKVLGE